MPRTLTSLVLASALFGSACSDDPCDPVQQTGCDDGKTCEAVSGGEPACFDPVAIEGRVFDLGDGAGIKGARVVGVDVNGSAVTNVVTSGDDGAYTLPIPTERNEDGTPTAPLTGNITLRADAVTYESFPGTIRQPLPIDISTAVEMDGSFVIKNALTDIAMTKLADGGATGRIEGHVELPKDVTGAVVVAEANGMGFPTIAARNGDYAILNVPNGEYTVQAYMVDHNYAAGSATVESNTVKVDLKLSQDEPSTVSGQVEIVDGNGFSTTSIVLFIESTYDTVTGRGVTVPGLRSPRSGAPDVTNAFAMDGVPAGKYVAVGAFENDGLVRDPDLCIAGTDDVHVEVAAATPLAIEQSFKITGALSVMAPGAMAAEAVSGTPTFTWKDDSSEDEYLVELFNAYGDLVWMKTIPGVSGGTPTLLYDGPALLQGMYYQYRVTSSHMTGTASRCNISRSEDLKGLFYVP